ncbi:MAG: peptidase [Candidatus Nitrosotenuis sp.]|nr:MAG: peptidase [Candidatus Nitrosotenuis sp.]
MKASLLVAIFAISLITVGFSSAHAQFQAGGIDMPGTWYVGEGLKKGDLFSYSLCHLDYKDCTPFQIDFWFKGDHKSGSETQWDVETVVHDGNKIFKGHMYLGKIAPEPTSSDPSISEFSRAFKSSLVWLSAYATSSGESGGKGPKQFSAPSWGKIGNIGGEQIIPTSKETVAVPEGTFDTALITWKTGGKYSRVWVLDDFPFPIKADTYAHVASGVPPQEYQFQLLDYQQNVSKDPFANIKATADAQLGMDCPKNYDFVSSNQNTNTDTMIVNVKYGPPHPKAGCDIEWIINFKRSVNADEFENEIHYDIAVVDTSKPGLEIARSVAQDEGHDFLFTTSGQVRRTTTVNEYGPSTYAIIVYGTGPEAAPPDQTKLGWVLIPIDIQKGTAPPSKDNLPPATATIPSWIKNNAKWWSDGTIGDSDFVQGIQYLINQKIIKIPATTPGSTTGSNVIPSWIKNNAKWWSDGTIGDSDFVQGIQYLIQQGIIKLKS